MTRTRQFKGMVSMESTKEKLYEIIETLPPPKLASLLVFAETLESEEFEPVEDDYSRSDDEPDPYRDEDESY